MAKHKSPPQFDSFNFQGITIHPPAAYAYGNAHNSHLNDTAHKLGKLYVRFYKEFGEYHRYALFNIKDDLFPSVKIANILLNKLKSEIK